MEEDATELLRLDDLSDEELYGDFEDLETGAKFKSKDSVVKKGKLYFYYGFYILRCI